MNFVRENLTSVVAIAVISIVWLFAAMVIASNPPTNIIKIHDMNDEIICYTYAGSIDCLQVAK